VLKYLEPTPITKYHVACKVCSYVAPSRSYTEQFGEPYMVTEGLWEKDPEDGFLICPKCQLRRNCCESCKKELGCTYEFRSKNAKPLLKMGMVHDSKTGWCCPQYDKVVPLGRPKKKNKSNGNALLDGGESGNFGQSLAVPDSTGDVSTGKRNRPAPRKVGEMSQVKKNGRRRGRKNSKNTVGQVEAAPTENGSGDNERPGGLQRGDGQPTQDARK